MTVSVSESEVVVAAASASVTALPFEIYLIKNSIDAIPLDLEESASIEKAGTFQILSRIILPLTMPGIASAARVRQLLG